jgi:hypothetical protein
MQNALRFRFDTTSSPEEKRITKIVLLTTVVCYLLYIFLGYPNFYEMVFESPHFVVMNLAYKSDLYWYAKIYYNWGIASLLFCVVPYLVARKLKITPRDLGVQVGNKKLGLILLVVGFVAVPFTAQVGILDTNFQNTYPLLRPEAVPALNGWLMVLGETSYVILYYIPYEFFWRGFAQFPLRKYGKINTFWIILWTTILSTLLHLPVPPSEIAGAAFVGIVYGWLALHANSIIYGFTHHAVTGVSADIVTAMAINGLL